MSTMGSKVVVRSTTAKVLFVLGIYGAMVSIPYLFSPSLTVSRSYISGFSNRVAIILLFVGTALFAALTRGKIGAQSAVDSKLGPRFLYVGLLLTTANGIFRICKWPLWVLPGGDAQYITNRFQLLAAGLIPYKQFEFAYGPLLLYPILWTQRIFHLSTIGAYNIVWLAQWELGVLMVWVVIRNIDFPIPYRGILFALLLAIQLAFSYFGGLNYTPFRAYFSSFCIVVAYQIWARTRNSWITTSAIIFVCALSIACSMEQAVGTIIGTFAIIALLWLSPSRKFSGLAFILALVGILACLYFADRMHLTDTMKVFGSGGYAYPLLPSPSIFLVVSSYIVAGCVLLRTLYARFIENGSEDNCPPRDLARIPITVPLTLAGCSMIPTALGRCDVLHITAAIPAFVVGVAVIFSISGLRRWWLPTACVALILLPMDLGSSPQHSLIKRHLPPKLFEIPDPALVAQGYTKSVPNNQSYVSPSHLTESQLPCDHLYFSPSFMPVATDKFLPQCLDTGYYFGVNNVVTAKTIQLKVDELQKHASEPLLMENTPLEAQLPLQCSNNQTLYVESDTLWIPPVRKPPLTYAPIIDYIREHYVQGPVLLDGRIRVWLPAGSSEVKASISR